MKDFHLDRNGFFKVSAVSIAGILLDACGNKPVIGNVIKTIQAATPSPTPTVTATELPQKQTEEVKREGAERVVATKSISLEKRHPGPYINSVMKYNILLALALMSGKPENIKNIKQEILDIPFKTEFTLKPNEIFAFDDQVPERLKTKVVKTTGSHFKRAEGFKYDGSYVGDGVCHLASIIFWVANEAKLSASAPSSHTLDIPEIPRQFQVSIWYEENSPKINQLNNLYVLNNSDKPVTFTFDYDKTNLTVGVHMQEIN